MSGGKLPTVEELEAAAAYAPPGWRVEWRVVVELAATHVYTFTQPKDALAMYECVGRSGHRTMQRRLEVVVTIHQEYVNEAKG